MYVTAGNAQEYVKRCNHVTNLEVVILSVRRHNPIKIADDVYADLHPMLPIFEKRLEVLKKWRDALCELK